MWIAITLYIAIFAIFNLGKGSGGWFADENDLSLYLNTMLPFCFYLFLVETKLWKRALYIATALASLIAEVVSFSRGGFVGLSAMFVFMILFSKKKILTLIFVSLIGIGVFYYGGEAYRNEMETITETQSGTAQARQQYWKAAWRMFIDNPFGVGGNNFQVRFPEYQSDWFGRGMWGRVAHSLWFTLIPELGIFGIFIYFSLLFHNIKDLLMLRSMEVGGDSDLKFLSVIATATLVSLAGFFTSATFLSVLYYPFYWYLTALIVSLCRVSSIIKTTNEMKDSNLAINESHSLV
jgi:probable O-glycosylation ligase (exosortase A-associated)